MSADNNQPFLPRPPPLVNTFLPSTTYETLTACSVPSYRDHDEVGPTYKNDSDCGRQAAAYENYSPASLLSQLPPLPPMYLPHHLHPSISAYQQQQQQQQASSYVKTENTASEQSSVRGLSERTIKFDNFCLINY